MSDAVLFISFSHTNYQKELFSPSSHVFLVSTLDLSIQSQSALSGFIQNLEEAQYFNLCILQHYLLLK